MFFSKKKKVVKETVSQFQKIDAKDIAAPSLIKEIMPGEKNATDYHVEIGTSTGDPVRYYRSFYAAFTGIYTYTGMINKLYQGFFGDSDCDVALHVTPCDRSQVMSELARKILGIESDIENANNREIINSLAREVEDLKRQQERLRLEIEKLFNISLLVTISDTKIENLNRNVNLMINTMRGSSIYMRSADTWQLDALLSTTPLGKKPKQIASRNMETSSVADMFPLGSGGLSFTGGIMPGLDNFNKPVFIDFWGLPSYNCVILGQTGSGKSFCAKRIIDLYTTTGVKVACIDPQLELMPMFKERGFPYFSLSAHSPNKINLFDVDVEEEEDGTARINKEDTIKSLVPVIYKMIRTIDPALLTGQSKMRLQEKLYELYENIGIIEDPASLYKPKPKGIIMIAPEKKDMPTLSDYYVLVKADDDLRDVAEVLKNFTNHGNIKSQAIFDGHTNIDIKNAPAFAFSLQKLDQEIMKPIGSFIVTQWIQRNFIWKNRSIRKMFMNDEAQLAMQDPEMAQWMGNQFKMSRKWNVSMVAITQGFEVFLGSVDGLAVLKQAAFKFIFKQDIQDIDAIQNKLNLSKGEADYIIKSARGHCVIKAGEESVICRIIADPESEKLYNTDPNKYANREKVSV